MTKLTGSLGVRNEINVDIIGTGARGKEGKSAYEIWLDLGNEGTEQEYLASLKGDTGPRGEQGIQGETGKSIEYTWNGTQLGVRIEGETNYTYVNLKGDKGDIGNTGKSLEFIWNGTQLGVRVEGDATYQYVNLKGDKGDTGAKGDKGDPGEVTAAELAAVTSQLAENADHAALWRTTTGNPVTCYPVPESPLYPKVSLVATQEGTGDPSPENIRPIIPALVNGGKVTLSHSDGVITPTQYEWTATRDIYGLPGAEAWMANDGSEYDTTTLLTLTGNEAWTKYAGNTIGYKLSGAFMPNRCLEGISSHFKPITVPQLTSNVVGVYLLYTMDLIVNYDGAADVTAFKAWLAAQVTAGTPVQILCKRATPATASGSAVSILALPQLDRYTPRQNVLTVDKGSLTVGYAKSPIRESDELQAAIAALS